MKRLAPLALVVAVLFGVGSPADAAPITVDLELSLVVDVSSSISNGEFDLQQTGYANSFRNLAVQQLITDLPNGIAANLIFYASGAQVGVASTHLTDAQSINDFADAIAAAPRPFFGGTNISAGINLAVSEFAANDFIGGVQVIDVSGDGTSGTSSTRNARDAALAAGVDTINGLVIGNQFLLDFYTDSVIGGDGAFALQVATFADFEARVTEKVTLEIGDVGQGPGNVPEPATLTVLGLAAVGMAGFGVRRRRKA